jgi:chromosome segregation ATPase
MHTKLEAISASTDDSKAYLFNQLQTIQRILLECAESNTTLERTCRFNEHLSSQLDAEKAKCSKLEEMILNLRRNEIDIQSRSSQLEIQLNELQKRANDLESDPSGFKQQIMELRSQLSKAEGDHHSATTRLQEAEQLRQLEESRAAEFKVRPLIYPHLHADGERQWPKKPKKRSLS